MAERVKLTEAQARMLRNAAKKGEIWPYGQKWRTAVALRDRGLIERTEMGMFGLTPAGRSALASQENDRG